MVHLSVGSSEIFQIDERILFVSSSAGGLIFATASTTSESPYDIIISIWKISNGLLHLGAITIPLLVTSESSIQSNHIIPRRSVPNNTEHQLEKHNCSPINLLWNTQGNRLFLQLPQKLCLFQIDWDDGISSTSLRDILAHDDMIEDNDILTHSQATISLLTTIYIQTQHISILSSESNYILCELLDNKSFQLFNWQGISINPASFNHLLIKEISIIFNSFHQIPLLYNIALKSDDNSNMRTLKTIETFPLSLYDGTLIIFNKINKNELFMSDKLHCTWSDLKNGAVSDIKQLYLGNNNGIKNYICLHTGSMSNHKEGTLSILQFNIETKASVVGLNIINTESYNGGNNIQIQFISIFKIKDNYVSNINQYISLDVLHTYSSSILLLYVDKHLTCYTHTPKVSKFLTVDIDSTLHTTGSVNIALAFGRLIIYSSSLVSSQIHVLSLLMSIEGSLQPQANGLMVDLADGSIITYSLKRPKSTLENLWHHTSLGLMNRSCEKIFLPSALMMEIIGHAILRGTKRHTPIIQGGIILAQSQDAEGKHIVCTGITNSTYSHSKNVSLWMYNSRNGRWRSTELMTTTTSRAFVQPSDSTYQSIGIFYMYNNNISTKWNELSVPTYIDQVIALSWFLDHTIIVLSIRKQNLYLELVSKNKLHSIIKLLPLDNISIFDVYIKSSSEAYVTISNGVHGYILLIKANIYITTSKGFNCIKSSPSNYTIQYLCQFNFHLLNRRIIDMKLFILDEILYLLCLDCNSYVITYNSNGEEDIIGDNFESIHRLEYSLKIANEYPPQALIKSYSMDTGNKIWSPELSLSKHHIISIQSFDRGNFFKFINGIIVWNISRNININLQPTIQTIITACLPSQIIHNKCLSLPFYLLLNHIYTNDDQQSNSLPNILTSTLSLSNILPITPTNSQKTNIYLTCVSNNLTKALQLASNNVISSSILVDSIESYIISTIESKLFVKSNPTYILLINTIFNFDPLLLIEIISSAIRKLEPSIHHRVFPLPLNSIEYSPIDAFTHCLLHGNINHCSRLLTSACEQLGGSENISASILSLAISTEFLYLTMTNISLSLLIESVEFCYRLEYLIAYDLNVKRQSESRQNNSFLWTLTKSLSNLLFTSLTLFIEEVPSSDYLKNEALLLASMSPNKSSHKSPRNFQTDTIHNDEKNLLLNKQGTTQQINEDETTIPIQNVFGTISKYISTEQFQQLLDSSLCTTYTIALYCHNFLINHQPLSCAIVITALTTSRGAMEGAYKRLFELLTMKTQFMQLASFLNSCLNTHYQSLKSSLELIRYILSTCGISDMDCCTSRGQLDKTLALPLGETTLRKLVDLELSSPSQSHQANPSRVVDVKFHPIHVDFNCYLSKPTNLIRLLRSLCYAAILSDKLSIAVALSYILGFKDITSILLKFAKGDDKVIFEHDAKCIMYFCFDEELLPKGSTVSSPSVITHEIDKELMDTNIKRTCMRAAEIILDFYHDKD